MASTDGPGRPSVMCIAPLSGFSGFAACSRALIDRAAAFAQPIVIDTGAITGHDARNHLGRLSAALRSCWVVMREPGGTPLILGMDGAFGILYRLPLIGIARSRRSSIVVHHHSFDYIDQRRRRVAIAQRLLGPRAVHLALCARMAAALVDLYGVAPAAVHVVGNAYAVAAPVGAASDRGGQLTVGFVGQGSREKGLDRALATMNKVLAADAAARAVVVGPIEDDLLSEVEALVERYPGRVTVLGLLLGDELEQAFAHLDVIYFPSRYRHEAMPLVLWEALRQGVRVAATEVGCIPTQLAGCTAVLTLASWLPAEDDEVAAWTLTGASAADAASARAHFERARATSVGAVERVLSHVLTSGR